MSIAWEEPERSWACFILGVSAGRSCHFLASFDRSSSPLATVPTNKEVFLCGFLTMQGKQISTSQQRQYFCVFFLLCGESRSQQG